MKIRKLVILCLVFTMLLGLVGCGPKDEAVATNPVDVEPADTNTPEATEAPKDPVVLEYWYFGDGPQKDTELVNEKFNELLQTYPGMEHVTVHFNPYYGGYREAVELALNAGEQIDILNTFSLGYNAQVENGTFLALDNLITENIKAELPAWLMELGKVGDSTYIVPNQQRASNQLYLVVPKQYMDNYGDLAKFKEVFNDGKWTIEEAAAILEEFTIACQEGEGKTKYAYPIGYLSQYHDGFRGRGDTVGNLFLAEDSEELVYPLSTEKVKTASEISARWYQEGLIHPDILTVSGSDFYGANFLNEVSYVYFTQNGYGSEEFAGEQYSASCGVDCYAIALYPDYYIGNSWAAGGLGITVNCEHPEEAMRFIELMNTVEGKDLYNMFVYGLEDVHYTRVSDTRIETLEYSGTQGDPSVSYSAPKWAHGNTVNVWLNQACPDNEVEIIEEINNNPNNVTSKLMGFVPDTTSITTEIDQMKAVNGEYLDTLTKGALGANFEKTYAEYVAKIEAAGLQTVMDELQAQVDAFLGK